MICPSTYIHCHHGKHRSPAAASVACVSAGLMPARGSLAVLKLAGTSKNYRGLYASAAQARPLPPTLLDELDVTFRPQAAVPPLAEAMVAMERTHDHLKAIAAADWQTPDEHPDLEPTHEALLLREYFTELLRTETVREQTAQFRRLLRDSESAAGVLERELQAWKLIPNEALPPRSLPLAFDRVTKNCASCHQLYRDVPRQQK